MTYSVTVGTGFWWLCCSRIKRCQHLQHDYTKANMAKLISAGYTIPFLSVEEGVVDYVLEYLARGFQIY